MPARLACLPYCMSESGAHYWLLFAFPASCTAVLLIILLCCTWEHFDNSCGDAPGLADDQSITAVLDRLELQCELSSKGLPPVDESTPEQKIPECLWLQISPGQGRYCGHACICAAAGLPPKGLWPMDKRPCWERCIAKQLCPWVNPCHSRYTPEETVAHR